MENRMREIIQLMSVEKAACNQILELSIHKKDALVQGDVTLLGDILKKEVEALKQLELCDNKRDTLAKQSSMVDEQFSVDDMIQHAQGFEKTTMIRLRDELRGLVKKINDANDANKKLIDLQLKYASFFLGMVTGEVSLGNTYDNTGYIKDVRSSRMSLIDQKV